MTERKESFLLGTPKKSNNDNYENATNLEGEIAKRKQVEQALRKSEEKFSELTKLLPITFFEVDKKGEFTFVNRIAFDTFGYSQEDFDQGLTILQIIIPENRDRFREHIDRILSGAKLGPEEYSALRKDGSTFPFVIHSSAIPDDGGSPAGLRGIVINITERKRVKKELKLSYVKLQRTLESTIQAMAKIVETRDPYTAGHQRRVANLACAVAEKMGLSEEQISATRMAAMTHDVGKIYIPAEILTKPGRLTEIEFNMVKTHTQHGYEILKTIEFPWPVAKIVLQHHERLNGSGYPVGLLGKDIILEAKILGVADVVEALASHRPYRPALSLDAVLAIISQGRGTLYDPKVSDICLKLFTEEGFQINQQES